MLFALLLRVRSFALLSLLPGLMVYFLASSSELAQDKGTQPLRKIMLRAAILSLATLPLLNLAKRNFYFLPDPSLGKAMPIIFAAAERAHLELRFNSLFLWSSNILNPLLKAYSAVTLHRIRLPIDTPVYIANLYDGVPLDWPVYFHYPTLWFTDAFVSFGFYGIAMAFIWALVNSLWELAMLRLPSALPLLLPFFCWHTYMLIRGAPAIASVPLSYAFYVSAAIYLPILFMRRLIASRLDESFSQ
ncbi:MAG: hypothetical protein H5T90_07740 [Acetomicrobium sp.]|nr:hypothetical protein [Acetomicrobium sp.]